MVLAMILYSTAMSKKVYDEDLEPLNAQCETIQNSNHISSPFSKYLLVVDNVEQECLVTKVGIYLGASLGKTDCGVEGNGFLDEAESDTHHLAVNGEEHGFIQKVDSTSNRVSLAVFIRVSDVLLSVSEIQKAIITVESPRIQIPT